MTYPATDGSQPCAHADPETFFPTSSGRGHTVELASLPAIRLCRRCPFIRACLGYALSHDVLGVWGGTTERQREELRQRHNITAEPLSDGLDDIRETA